MGERRVGIEKHNVGDNPLRYDNHDETRGLLAFNSSRTLPSIRLRPVEQ